MWCCRFWRQVPGHLRCVESNSLGLVWGIGWDGTAWVFSGRYGQQPAPGNLAPVDMDPFVPHISSPLKSAPHPSSVSPVSHLFSVQPFDSTCTHTPESARERYISVRLLCSPRGSAAPADRREERSRVREPKMEPPDGIYRQVGACGLGRNAVLVCFLSSVTNGLCLGLSQRAPDGPPHVE